MFRTKIPQLALTEDEAAYKAKSLESYLQVVLSKAELTPKQRKKLEDKLLLELDQHINNARLAGKTPEQLDQESVDAKNVEICNEREILLHGYSLTREDFDKDILPILCKFSFAPNPSDLGWDNKPMADSLYLASSPDYTSRDAQQNLRGKCDEVALSRIVQSLRRNYETLRKAEMANLKFVRVICDHHSCLECKKLNANTLSVADLLLAFRAATVPFPHELVWDDVPQWCDGIHLMAGEKDVNPTCKYNKGDDCSASAYWLNSFFNT